MLLLLVLIALTGCGYRFPGVGAFPAGVERVYLEAEPEDSQLVRALEDALNRDRAVDLVDSRAGAEAVLRVEGGEATSSAAAIGATGEATEYEVTLRADYRLLRPRVDGVAPEGGEAPGESEKAPEEGEAREETDKAEPDFEVLRERSGLVESSTYPYDPATSPAAEEANKRRAARQAAEALAEGILDSIKSGF
ncbi:hypothetical protein AN478_10440 [Thiohalorhabdus denitrificans]|uniref:Lipopolysaccharide-assembly n=1 Tax=Thiohalorhabdus denitrificans TaxID=381306 RepID=A0A0P9GHT5_9GAMM|nr:LPS assembly lipoprotein LptE [Thiohalorhabdus denitrificans]KPV39555.1 hypothetical protein AN478_10440 [Thiohalorhabdus denitrificans]SCX98789.1 Lipopolysaccharide-assembly [Thiohalorhabdus denitrificans]